MTDQELVLDPTRRGWHWLERAGENPEPWHWSGTGLWWQGREHMNAKEAAFLSYRYVGPCPTPAEMAERSRVLSALAKAFAGRVAAGTWDGEDGRAGLIRCLDGYYDLWGVTPLGEQALGRLALACAQEGT